MTTTIILVSWIGVPAILILLNVRKVWNLYIRLLHDRILYGFCQVRDAIAVKAANGEISEDGAIFRTLYTNNAMVIHHHAEFGRCLVKFFKTVHEEEEMANEAANEFSDQLIKEMELADEETKQIAMKYTHTLTMALFMAEGAVFLDRIKRILKTTDEAILRFLSSSPMLSRAKRETANRCLKLMRAAMY